MSNRFLSLQEAFSEVKDFRNAQGRRYKLQSILALASLAMMHGAESEQAIAEWSETHGHRWLKFLGIKRKRGPSQATIHRIFKGLDRMQLESVLDRWADREPGDVKRPGRDRSQISPGGMSEWMRVMRNHLPGLDELSTTISPGQHDPDLQPLSEAGLKIWANESIESRGEREELPEKAPAEMTRENVSQAPPFFNRQSHNAQTR
ncbi:MAG TPA: transposase family protein [Blastocatellia bacterium]|nr:transposase family protein [Blastocatellia bacterium]